MVLHMKNLGLNYNFRLEGFYLSSNLFNSFSRFKVENDDFRTYWGIFCFFACFEMSYHESGFPSFPSKMFGIFKNMSLFCFIVQKPVFILVRYSAKVNHRCEQWSRTCNILCFTSKGSLIWSFFASMGHPTTKWPELCPFLTPHLCVDSFYTLSVDKTEHFLVPSPSPHIVVVIEWPLTSSPKHEPRINLKFLSYGTIFFGSSFWNES